MLFKNHYNNKSSTLAVCLRTAAYALPQIMPSSDLDRPCQQILVTDDIVVQIFAQHFIHFIPPRF